MISRYHPPVHPWSHLPVVSHLVSIRYAAPDNGPTDTCCTPCKCSPVSHQWPVTRGPRGPGIKQSTRLLALTSPTLGSAPRLVTMGSQWLLRADPGPATCGHAHTRLCPTLTCQKKFRVCRSSPSFSCIELPGGRRDPLAVTFLSADTVFVLPVFLSLSNSVLHSIHFLFFSLPPLFFEQRQKKVEQRRPSFKLNHSDTEWIAECVSVILQFSVGAWLPVSHTVDHVGERQRRVRAN